MTQRRRLRRQFASSEVHLCTSLQIAPEVLVCFQLVVPAINVFHGEMTRSRVHFGEVARRQSRFDVALAANYQSGNWVRLLEQTDKAFSKHWAWHNCCLNAL